MSMYQFAATYGNPRNGVRFRRAKITANPSGNRVALSVDDPDGLTTHTNVTYFGALPPRTGQSVWVVVVGGEVFCLGSAADQGGEVPHVELTRSVGQSIPSGVGTDISWDVLVGSDSWDMWSSGADVTIPIQGIYVVNCTVSFNNNLNGTYRISRITHGGAIRGSQQVVHPTGTVGNSVNTVLTASAIIRASAGDIVRGQAVHDVGANLDIQVTLGGPRLTVAYLGAWS